MHHTLKFYNANRPGILRFYMFFAAGTRIPWLGRLVRKIANIYGRSQHHAYLLSPSEAEELVAMAGGIASAPCTCRTIYHKCRHPTDNEILLAPSRHILRETMPHDAQEITPRKSPGNTPGQPETGTDSNRPEMPRGLLRDMQLLFLLLRAAATFQAVRHRGSAGPAQGYRQRVPGIRGGSSSGRKRLAQESGNNAGKPLEFVPVDVMPLLFKDFHPAIGNHLRRPVSLFHRHDGVSRPPDQQRRHLYLGESLLQHQGLLAERW